jgi:chorismate mutase
VRGIRGATSASADTRNAILEATRELLGEMLRANGIVDFDEIASIVLTTTPDLTATFPAEAARELGMNFVPLLCASEIAVPGRLARCVRVLMHVNTDTPAREMVHVYLREAKSLRPDVQSAQ